MVPDRNFRKVTIIYHMRIILLFCTLLLAVLPSAAVNFPSDTAVRWTMLNITQRTDVADSHLLQTPNGHTIVIDMGLLGDSPNAVINQLKEKHITNIDLVVISHFHIDHYGALLDVHDAGISIKKVIVNVPDKAAADPERPWGCNLDHVHEVLAGLRARNIPYHTPAIGERLWEERTASGIVTSLDVVCLYDGLNTPIGRTDVNDTSIILRLAIGSTRALFTGDLNHALGQYLADSELDLSAHILKVPHHGLESAAPNEFFTRVGAKAALVPCPRHLWESDRAARIRCYFATHKVPIYVSGLDGTVTATMTEHGYTIVTER